MSAKKRNLTSAEIKNIVKDIEPIKTVPLAVASSIRNKIISNLLEQLKTVQIYPKMYDSFKEKIVYAYYRSQVEPGECVGMICGQSIGEKQTQSTLNVFHKAGSADRQPITSQFSELFNATAEPKAPAFMIYFSYGNQSLSELRQTIGSDIVNITLEDVIQDIDYQLQSNDVKLDVEPWYEAWYILNPEIEKLDLSQFIRLTLQLNLDVLYEYGVTPTKISYILNQVDCLEYCICAPDNFARIDIFVSKQSVDINSLKCNYVTEENYLDIYCDEILIPYLEELHVCGIKGVKNMFFIRDGDKWGIETENESYKVTSSVRRFHTLLAQPFVDIRKTISTSIWDIYHTFGILATKQFLFEQFTRLMKSIDSHHINTLVDKMTYEGTVSSISRFTMRKEDSGPLTKASFEESLDNLIRGGVYTQTETTDSISGAIVCARRGNFGTGQCDIFYDMTKI